MVLETMEAKLEDFNQVFQKFRSDEATKKHLKFILFLADKDPLTSRSWCPGISLSRYLFLLSSFFFLGQTNERTISVLFDKVDSFFLD
jgi:hypothetical protein